LDFKVRGHSKYNIKLENNLVKKFYHQKDDRLVLSAKKQNKFKSSFFKKPKVKKINEDSFLMEYIKGDSFSQFFTRATKRDLDGLISKIKGYLNEIIVSEMELPIDVIINKLNNINYDSTYIIDKIKNKKTIKIKVGKCHGDLTFSNMIFAEDVYLIDFLDSYLESPTIDIVKLRQDTHLYWSLNMVDDIVDLTKIKLGLNYIDKFLVEQFDIEDYTILQIVNLIRIKPYVKDEKINKWINDNLNKLCELL